MLILDAGALIAVDRDDRRIAVLAKRELLARRPPRTHGGVVGQVWRSGARQANLAKLLRALEIVALDDEFGRRAGQLLAKARQSDVIDAAVVLLATHGDEIVTSDPADLRSLCEAAQLQVDLIVV